MRISVPPCVVALWLVSLVAAPLAAQDAQDEKQPPSAEEENKPPEIPDEPRTVDPASLVPEKLAAKVTVEFTESSLREIAEWIQENREIVVLFDNKALSEAGIPLGEPVSDRLDDAPLYLLLNRLQSLGLAWYVSGDILHITTTGVSEERMSTQTYNASDLLDAGYTAESLSETVMEASGGRWEEIDGSGGNVKWLGDVLFVRHTDAMHRRVRGLLQALRKHGRRTFTFDPPQHRVLRETLEQNVSVNFVDRPLLRAVEEIARLTDADIRLDKPALRAQGIRDREPVSLTLADRPLKTVLHVLFDDLDLTWILRDGVLWVTSNRRAEHFQKTAVFDVRDLCRDEDESNALIAAVQSQTSGLWEEIDGSGGIILSARPGALVVRHTERALREIEELLATYRKALAASKPRQRDDGSQEVVTRYYRMHEETADDLEELLPRLVDPGTWQTPDTPDATGTILKVASTPEPAGAVTLSHSVLIIRQTRAAHEKVADVIRRVETGDPLADPGFGGMGGGFGGGGFGGGFFQVPPSAE